MSQNNSFINRDSKFNCLKIWFFFQNRSLLWNSAMLVKSCHFFSSPSWMVTHCTEKNLNVYIVRSWRRRKIKPSLFTFSVSAAIAFPLFLKPLTTLGSSVPKYIPLPLSCSQIQSDMFQLRTHADPRSYYVWEGWFETEFSQLCWGSLICSSFLEMWC